MKIPRAHMLHLICFANALAVMASAEDDSSSIGLRGSIHQHGRSLLFIKCWVPVPWGSGPPMSSLSEPETGLTYVKVFDTPCPKDYAPSYHDSGSDQGTGSRGGPDVYTDETKVALSEDGLVMVIGEPRYHTQTPVDGVDYTNTGRVRVLYRPTAADTTWSAKGNILFPCLDSSRPDELLDAGYDVAIDNVGEVIAVHCAEFPGSLSDEGRIEVYKFVSGSWTLVGQPIDSGVKNGLLGRRLDMRNYGTNGVAVAASMPLGLTPSIFVFTYADVSDDNLSWDRSRPAIQGPVGSSLGLLDIVLSADSNKVMYSQGLDSVSISEFDGTQWNLRQTIVDTTPPNVGDGTLGSYPYFASALDMNDDASIIAVAESAGHGVDDAYGTVKVFKWSGSTYTKIDSIKGGINEKLGRDVGLNHDGSFLAIGISGYNNDAGRVDVWTLDSTGNDYVRVGTVYNPDTNESNQFGTQIAMSGSGFNLAISTEENHEIHTYQYF